jgi:hypothetical protein
MKNGDGEGRGGRKGGRKGGREGGREREGRERERGGREGGKEGGREGEGREGEREREREGGREGKGGEGREGERKGGRERGEREGRERGREKGREREREGGSCGHKTVMNRPMTTTHLSPYALKPYTGKDHQHYKPRVSLSAGRLLPNSIPNMHTSTVYHLTTKQSVYTVIKGELVLHSRQQSSHLHHKGIP